MYITLILSNPLSNPLSMTVSSNNSSFYHSLSGSLSEHINSSEAMNLTAPVPEWLNKDFFEKIIKKKDNDLNAKVLFK